MKVGRNKPCPCGSGRKFKHCHGHPNAARTIEHANSTVPPMILEQVKGQQAQEVRRQQQQGLGRPIVSNLVGGFRLVAIGDQLVDFR